MSPSFRTLAWLAFIAWPLLLAAQEPVKVSIAASAAQSEQADLITVELSKHDNLQMLERAALDALFHERMLSRDIVAKTLPGRDAVLLVEEVEADSTKWLVARLVGLRSSSVLATVAAPSADKALVQAWPHTVAEAVIVQLPRLKLNREQMKPVSVVNFRPAYAEGTITHLPAQEAAGRLLADRLAQWPGLSVLDRTSLSVLSFEKALRGVADESFWKTGHVVDGTFARQGEIWSAELKVRTAGGASTPLKIAKAGSLRDLVDQAANAIAKAAEAGGEPVPWSMQREADIYAHEADWLWKTGQRQAAVSAASASTELGGQSYPCRFIAIASYWHKAWPNLQSVHLSNPPFQAPQFEVLRPDNFQDSRSWQSVTEGLSGNASFWLLHDNGRQSPPSVAQLQGVVDGLEELKNMLSMDVAHTAAIEAATGRERGRLLAVRPWWAHLDGPMSQGSLATVESFWGATMGLGSILLDQAYAAPNLDSATEKAVNALRQQMRVSLDLAARLWDNAYYKAGRYERLPWRVQLADSLEESANALEAWLFNRPVIEVRTTMAFKAYAAGGDAPLPAERLIQNEMAARWRSMRPWTDRHTRYQIKNDRIISDPSMVLYDWQKRDLKAADSRRETLFRTWGAPGGPPLRRMAALVAQVLALPDDNPRLRAFELEALRIVSTSPEALGDLKQAPLFTAGLEMLLERDRLLGWTRTDLIAGRTDLMKGWIAAHSALCDHAATPLALTFTLGHALLEKTPSPETWTRQLYEGLQRYAKRGRQPGGSDLSAWTPLQFARETGYDPASSPAPAKGPVPPPSPTGSKLGPTASVVPVSPRLWPPDRDSSPDEIMRLGGTFVDGDTAFCLPAYTTSSDKAPTLHVIKLPDFKEDRKINLWRRGEAINSVDVPVTVHVESGKAHIAAGRSFMTVDLQSRRTVAEYSSPDLAFTRSSWCDGSWVGATSRRDNVNGSLLAHIKVAEKRHVALADTLRNPAVNEWDRVQTWKLVWPVVPVRPGIVCAFMGTSTPVLWNTETDKLQSPLFAGERQYLSRSAPNVVDYAVSNAGGWSCIMARPETPGDQLNVVAFDQRTGEMQVLLWASPTHPSAVEGKPFPAALHDQPPPPDHEVRSTVGITSTGAVCYDGRRLIVIMPCSDLAGHARLFVWEEGSRGPTVSRLLEFPASRICKPKEALQRFNIIGGRITVLCSGLVNPVDLWSCKAGLLMRCKNVSFDSQALMFVTWAELGIPAP